MADEEPISDEDVRDLLRQAQAVDEPTREFAAIHLTTYRDELVRAVVWQRTEGRTLVLGGADPEHVRRLTEARIGEARRQLHGRLLRLLAWAREAGWEPGGG